MSEEAGFDPSKRRLCPDGACVGVIGPDGKCGECGRVVGPDERAEVAFVASDIEPAPSPGDAVPASDAGVNPAEAPPPSPGDGGFDPARRLCDDGACVGVIGADGKCGVCGRVVGS